MPTIVAATVVTFEAIEVAVFVTTFWTPPMSFEIRDCTSPVRVRVKKASDSRCRWRKTAARRSCITRWPTWFESSVWTTPEHADDDRDRDHPAGVERERAGVVRPDRLEHALEQERRHHAERRGDDDQQEQPAEPQPCTARTAGPIRRRFARRTAGSAGRSGGASDKRKNLAISIQDYARGKRRLWGPHSSRHVRTALRHRRRRLTRRARRAGQSVVEQRRSSPAAHSSSPAEIGHVIAARTGRLAACDPAFS